MPASLSKPFKPTAAQLLAARDTTVPDLVRPGLRVLFCGINPGLYSAAVGHHFARPGNRFWPALRASGFTDRLLSPFEERELLGAGIGITNVVCRATASADELSREELAAGARKLQSKVRRYKPRVLAVLGMGAYRTAFGRRDAGPGLQAETIEATQIWVLPNPSGLNAHYQPRDLARFFGQVREFVDKPVNRPFEPPS
jgi:TDG/mug DNA glycosylase family protein